MDSIKLGFFDTPMHEATAAIVLRVLEAHDISNIELITGEKAALIQELREGEIDIFTTIWEPEIHQKLLEGISMKKVGNLYQPSLFLALPNQFKDQVVSIEDLLNVSDIDRQVTVPETLCNITNQLFYEYGLSTAGFGIQPRSDEEVFAMYQKIIQQQEPKLMMLFTPNFLDDSDQIYKLTDTKAFFKPEYKASTLVSDKVIHAIGSDLIDELEELTLGNHIVKALELAMRQDGLDAYDAAEEWQRGKLIVRV